MAPFGSLKPALRAAAACGALAAAALLAYENDGRAKAVKGGPHRAINRLAHERFFDEKKADPVVSRYDLSRSKTLLDETYVSGDMFRPGKGDRSATFTRWIEEGGYTADEPELYASFRHFYDPLALNAEQDGPAAERLVDAVLPVLANPGAGVPYLTDDLNDLNLVYVAIVGSTVNPRIHAKEWAIDGPENNGWGENPYCWKKGIEYVEKAFAATGSEKQRLWAKAWRSLGETMHLLADMTSVPHVRNDSHPSASTYLRASSNDVGRLRSDPYETLAQEALVVSSASGAPPAVPLGGTPEELFDAVAGFTNASFFSADTIAGTDPVSGAAVTNANGMRPYPSPRLEECREENGYFVKEVAGRPVRMAHRSWLASAGWGQTMGHVRLSSACVRDQASILVPLAVAANAKLVDLFLPRVRVEIEDVDLATKKLRGKVIHVPYGAHRKELKYSSGPGELSTIRLDDGLQDFDRYKVEIRDGVIDADLSGLDLKKGQTLRLDVEVGGIVVKSGEIVLGDDLLARLQKTRNLSTSVSLKLKARTTAIWLALGMPEKPKPETSEREESFSLDVWNAFEVGAKREEGRTPLAWNGPFFTTSARSTRTEVSNSGDPRCDVTVDENVEMSGTVDTVRRTISTLTVKYRRESGIPHPDCHGGWVYVDLGIRRKTGMALEYTATDVPLFEPSLALQAETRFILRGSGTGVHLSAASLETSFVGPEGPWGHGCCGYVVRSGKGPAVSPGPDDRIEFGFLP